MNGAPFKTYLQKQLVPALKPADIVICDNLAAHKVAGGKDIIEVEDAEILYWPSCSLFPFSGKGLTGSFLFRLKPIEQAFAKLKALLRKAMARAFNALWKTIGRLLKRFSKQGCRNYFTNSGYDHY